MKKEKKEKGFFCCSFSNAIALASKRPSHRPSRVFVYDALNGSIRSHGQDEDAGEDDEDIQDTLGPASQSPILEQGDGAVRLAHAEVRDSPEDEPEEGVE